MFVLPPALETINLQKLRPAVLNYLEEIQVSLYFWITVCMAYA